MFTKQILAIALSGSLRIVSLQAGSHYGGATRSQSFGGRGFHGASVGGFHGGGGGRRRLRTWFLIAV